MNLDNKIKAMLKELEDAEKRAYKGYLNRLEGDELAKALLLGKENDPVWDAWNDQQEDGL